MVLLFVCATYFAAELMFVWKLAEDPTRALLDSYWILDPALLTTVGALDLTRVWIEQEWWRLLTTSFMHGSWIHLVLNLTALASIGPWIERVWGARGLLTVFVMSALAGALASCAWAEARYVVGASAGILGLAALLWIARLWGPVMVRIELEPILANRLGWMLGAIILLGFYIPAIAQAGHIGGLVAGGLAALMYLHPQHYRLPASVGSLAMAGVLLAATLQPEGRPNYPFFVGFRLIEQGDVDRSLPYLEDALESRPDDAILQNAIAYQFALLGVELERAEQLVTRALAQDPESPDFLDTLGWIRCKQGRTEEGLKQIQKARKMLDTPNDEIEEHVETCAEVGPDGST